MNQQPSIAQSIASQRRISAAVAAFATLATAGATGRALAQPVIYVDDDAPIGGDGSSWTKAFQSIGAALDPLSGATWNPHGYNIVVRVAQGVYAPTRGPVAEEYDRLTLNSGMTLMGGYRGLAGGGNPNDRSPAVFPTIIDGGVGTSPDPKDNTRVALELTRSNRVEGFHFRNVQSSFIESQTSACSIQIADCTFTNDQRLFSIVRSFGNTPRLDLDRCNVLGVEAAESLISLTSGSIAQIEDCRFDANVSTDSHSLMFLRGFISVEIVETEFTRNTGNWASLLEVVGGGTVDVHGLLVADNVTLSPDQFGCPVQITQVYGPVLVEECQFLRNQYQQGDPGNTLRIGSASGGAVTSCSFVENKGDGGAALFLFEDTFYLVENSLFAGNHGRGFSTAIRAAAYVDIKNCTIVGNTHQGSGTRPAIRTDLPWTTFLSNTIVWNNTSNGQAPTFASQIFPLQPSRVFDSIVTGIAGIQGNLALDPRFIGPGDYRLGVTSPGINLGFNPAFAPLGAGIDLAGMPRVRGGFVDAGCYEAALSEGCSSIDMAGTAIRGTPGYRVPNAAVTSDDFFVFLDAYVRADAAADVTTTAPPGTPGHGVPNGLLTSDDFFYFLVLFQQGC